MFTATTFNLLNRPALAKVARHFNQLKIVQAKSTHQTLKPSLEVVAFLSHGLSLSTALASTRQLTQLS
ncbi:MAG: hypothetical protein ACI9XZ_004675 [Alphaproteobacteria bacterium]|jgi:hypothetical protein